MGNKHAILSPSGSHKWVNCPGSARLEQTIVEETTSAASSEGTAAHFLASETLAGCYDTIPEEWIKTRTVTVVNGVAYWSKEAPVGRVDGYYYLDTGEMVEHVQTYVNNILEYVGDDGTIAVEQALDISTITGEEGATGTADAVVIRGSELQIHDLKYGFKPVDAEQNSQLIVYAAAALELFGDMYGIDTVTMVIHQPRVYATPSWTVSVQDLIAEIAVIKQAATRAGDALALTVDELALHGYLTPGSHCTKGFCKARVVCPALKEAVLAETAVPAKDLGLEELAEKAKLLDMVTGWVEAVQQELYSAVCVRGDTVPGFKAVLGREGNRKWNDEAEVETLLKSMKLKQEVIYQQKLNSPTTLAKEAKNGNIGPRQWPKIEEHIVREQAKLVVAPIADKRPAVTVNRAIDDFEIIS